MKKATPEQIEKAERLGTKLIDDAKDAFRAAFEGDHLEPHEAPVLVSDIRRLAMDIMYQSIKDDGK